MKTTAIELLAMSNANFTQTHTPTHRKERDGEEQKPFKDTLILCWFFTILWIQSNAFFSAGVWFCIVFRFTRRIHFSSNHISILAIGFRIEKKSDIHYIAQFMAWLFFAELPIQLKYWILHFGMFSFKQPLDRDKNMHSVFAPRSLSLSVSCLFCWTLANVFRINLPQLRTLR